MLDCGAPFEPKAIKALKVIEAKDHATYQRIRAELKKVNKSISLFHLDLKLRGPLFLPQLDFKQLRP